ncbi:multicopper oxidase family protein [Litorivicinus sp.]|nr:multicopper oxidase family protein [Litorivicinus sp.]MDC1239472.1 multicopper oxidase family protein [Litorivicinus sp.]MDC1466765.1 multicopper oxidase family protein [Litorivicinus sp.]
MSFSRRQFIKGLGSLTAGTLFSFPLQSKPMLLQASQIKKRFIVGTEYRDADVWAFNQSVPGPELRFQKGDLLSIDFQNNLPEGSSVHWHGIRNINAMDGVAGLTQPAVLSNESFRYQFPLMDAGTYWYHSHAKTWSQVARGLYGPLIVEDPTDPDVDHDVVLMIDDWLLRPDGTIDEESFGSLHDWAHGGRLGNWLTVNGESHPLIDVKSGSRIRLRLINAANARIFNLKIPVPASVIARDGFACPIQTADVIVLGPGQRTDLIIDIGSSKETIFEASGKEPYPAVTVNPIKKVGKLVTKIPLTQPVLSAPPETTDVTVQVHMQGGAMGNLQEAEYEGQTFPIRELAQKHKKVWAFNGKISSQHDRLAKVSLGQVVKIEIWNDTRWHHAMHLHGHHFWIQAESGLFAGGKRDTYLFEPGEKTNLIFLADNPGFWLFHCHMLEHHASGMGAVIEVG